MTTIRETLNQLAAQLREATVDAAEREAEIIISHVLDKDRAWLFAHSDDLFPQTNQPTLEEIVKKRLVERQPLAYIFGDQPFLDLNLQVSPKVLIPRPETEYLIELLKEKTNHRHFQAGRFLDVGTGSGAIAIALKRLFPDAQVFAADNSAPALRLAQVNARAMKTEVTFLESDLLAAIPELPFDLIVANLPYVPESEWLNLQPEITDWEPKDAIVAGPDGLSVITRLLAEVGEHLKTNSLIALEIWPSQDKAIRAQVAELWPSAEFELIKDLAGRDRFIFVEFHR